MTAFNMYQQQYLTRSQFQYQNPTWIRIVMDSAKQLFRWVPSINELETSFTQKSLPNLNQSMQSSETTSSLKNQYSQKTIGDASHNNVMHSKTSLMFAGPDNAQAWIELMKKANGGYVTQLERVEARALAKVHNSVYLNSSQAGHKNDRAYTQIHNYINYLVEINVLPQESVVGRLNFANYTRTGLAVPVSYLEANEDLICQALEDRYPKTDAEEIYKIMLQASIMAAYHRLVDFKAPALQHWAKTISVLPTSVQSMMFNSAEHLNTVRNNLLNK